MRKDVVEPPGASAQETEPPLDRLPVGRTPSAPAHLRGSRAEQREDSVRLSHRFFVLTGIERGTRPFENLPDLGHVPRASHRLLGGLEHPTDVFHRRAFRDWDRHGRIHSYPGISPGCVIARGGGRQRRWQLLLRGDLLWGSWFRAFPLEVFDFGGGWLYAFHVLRRSFLARE